MRANGSLLDRNGITFRNWSRERREPNSCLSWRGPRLRHLCPARPWWRGPCWYPFEVIAGAGVLSAGALVSVVEVEPMSPAAVAAGQGEGNGKGEKAKGKEGFHVFLGLWVEVRTRTCDGQSRQHGKLMNIRKYFIHKIQRRYFRRKPLRIQRVHWGDFPFFDRRFLDAFTVGQRGQEMTQPEMLVFHYGRLE